MDESSLVMLDRMTRVAPPFGLTENPSYSRHFSRVIGFDCLTPIQDISWVFRRMAESSLERSAVRIQGLGLFGSQPTLKDFSFRRCVPSTSRSAFESTRGIESR